MTQAEYDATLGAYEALQEGFLRASPRVKLDASVASLDAQVLAFATRVMEKEFVSYEESLRDLCKS